MVTRAVRAHAIINVTISNYISSFGTTQITYRDEKGQTRRQQLWNHNCLDFLNQGKPISLYKFSISYKETEDTFSLFSKIFFCC